MYSPVEIALSSRQIAIFAFAAITFVMQCVEQTSSPRNPFLQPTALQTEHHGTKKIKEDILSYDKDSVETSMAVKGS